jgi:hypothetical protein
MSMVQAATMVPSMVQAAAIVDKVAAAAGAAVEAAVAVGAAVAAGAVAVGVVGVAGEVAAWELPPMEVETTMTCGQWMAFEEATVGERAEVEVKAPCSQRPDSVGCQPCSSLVGDMGCHSTHAAACGDCYVDGP